jgi:hypothetical protein
MVSSRSILIDPDNEAFLGRKSDKCATQDYRNSRLIGSSFWFFFHRVRKPIQSKNKSYHEGLDRMRSLYSSHDSELSPLEEGDDCIRERIKGTAGKVSSVDHSPTKNSTQIHHTKSLMNSPNMTIIHGDSADQCRLPAYCQQTTVFLI